MFQEIIALIIIAFFLTKLIWQKKNKQIQKSEFVFWLFFWIIATVIILLIKQIDQLVASLGFTGSGIDVAFYLGVALLFYLIFRVRLKLAKIDKQITNVVEKIALKEKE
ncbi:MAG: DUF2304 family protein [bacterium]